MASRSCKKNPGMAVVLLCAGLVALESPTQTVAEVTKAKLKLKPAICKFKPGIVGFYGGGKVWGRDVNLEFVTNVTLGVCASLCDSFAPQTRTATQPRWPGEGRCVAFQHNPRTKKCGLKRVRTRAADALPARCHSAGAPGTRTQARLRAQAKQDCTKTGRAAAGRRRGFRLDFF